MPSPGNPPSDTLLTGLDRLVADDFRPVRGHAFALLLNQTAVDREGVHLLEHLARRGLAPVSVFSPEHGLWSTHQDMEAVGGARTVGRDGNAGTEADPVFGTAVRSLYGATERSLDPDPELFRGVELLVADMQDIGSRYYTYAATLVRCMRTAVRAGVRVLVLDRPNPIGGTAVEGNQVLPSMRSFVGEIPVPQRHGLTLGELALYAARTEKLDVDLEVVRIQGWPRSQHHAETGRPWIPPSPNMPTPATALVYPGLCLLEGTNVSEGRGTTTPFELFGAPWIDPVALAAGIRDEDPCPGFLLTPAAFRPQFGKFAGKVCRGLRLHVTDRGSFRPLAFGLTLIKWLFHLYPVQFTWRTEAYEFVSDRPAIDLLLGDPDVRQRLERGEAVGEIMEWMEDAARPFLQLRPELVLY